MLEYILLKESDNDKCIVSSHYIRSMYYRMLREPMNLILPSMFMLKTGHTRLEAAKF